MFCRLAPLAAFAFWISASEAQVAAGAPMLSLGSAHSCALDSRGAVWCWGDNSSGQLGDGTVGAQLKLDVLNLSGGIAAIGAGYQHTCALTLAGGVKCWGSNTYGELGDGTTAIHVAAADVVGFSSGVGSIAVGASFACALTTAGAVRCWGANNGNLGTGNFNDSLVPAAVSGLAGGVSAITAGEGHACALLAGSVKCWGVNANGQLGDTTTTTRTVPVDVAGLPPGIIAIAAGARHSCVITDTGGAKCWGSNDQGQLGDGSLSNRTAPVDVAGLQSGVRALALSTHASCALMQSGAVKCWGSNDYTEQGNGYGPRNLTPADVATLAGGSVSIAAGFNHFCVVSVAGAMSCWGYNRLGQLGNGTTHDGELPKPVIGIPGPVTAMGLGGLHTCAAVAGGAKCWGANLFGQLGNVTSRRYNIAGPVSGLSSGTTAIAATDSSTCAVVTGGAVKCWGSNRYGELGDGTLVDHALPGDVAGLSSGIRGLAAGAIYVCALSTGGGVRCWGADDVVNITPRQISGLTSGVLALAAGSQHGCALTTAGAAKCWGKNERGQLGNGQTAGTNTPVDVVGLGAGVVALAAGTLHSCALQSNGNVKCWGANDYGQLGNGTSVSSATPVDVVGLPREVVRIVASVDSTCALTASGAFWCWGQISQGRRGVPWPVPGLSTAIVSIATSNTHACALVVGGGVRCFGANAAGQLGDGTSVLERGNPETVVAADGASFLDLTPEDPLVRALLSPFVALTSGLGSNVTAQVQIPAQPGGTTNVYVFALAPANIVRAAATAYKDEPLACVLAQLNASGQLQGVSASSLQAYVTNVVGSQMQAVTVLNGVPTVNIAGSTFYVGLGATGSQMLANGTTRSVTSVSGATECKPHPPQTGWWWNTAEGGRGYSIEVAGNHIFFATYLYDTTGRATWHVASGSTALDGSLFIGRLESYSGGQTLSGPFHPTAFSSYAGDITLAFSDSSHGLLIWPGGSTAIERFEIVPGGANLTALSSQPENGWWWNPAESGRGFFFEWQGGTLFMAGYMYDDAGDPTWYLSSGTAIDLQAYSNTWRLFANGQTLSGAYKPAQQVNANVAPVTITFHGATSGLMTLPGGRTTSIQRFGF